MTMVDVLRPCAANAMIKVKTKQRVKNENYRDFKVDACVFNSTPWWKEMDTKQTESKKPSSER